MVVFLYQKFSNYSLLSYFYSRIRERNIDFLSFSFFLFYLFIFFLFSEIPIFKARIGELNLPEQMKQFLLLPHVIISWLLQKIFVSLMNGLYTFLVSIIRGQKTAANKEQLKHLYIYIFQDVLLLLEWEDWEKLINSFRWTNENWKR